MEAIQAEILQLQASMADVQAKLQGHTEISTWAADINNKVHNILERVGKIEGAKGVTGKTVVTRKQKDPKNLEFKNHEQDEVTFGTWSFEFAAHFDRLFDQGERFVNTLRGPLV